MRWPCRARRSEASHYSGTPPLQPRSGWTSTTGPPAFAAGWAALAAASPDQRAGAAAARVSQAVESLLSTIDTDRGLRLGPPSPTDEQLAYSEALLSQRAVEVGRAAHDLEAAATPTT